jgi:hypothetical protein
MTLSEFAQAETLVLRAQQNHLTVGTCERWKATFNEILSAS